MNFNKQSPVFILQLFFTQICKKILKKAETQKVLMKSEQVWNKKTGKRKKVKRIKNKHRSARPSPFTTDLEQLISFLV